MDPRRDGLLFGFAGPQLVCLDAATGEVRWRERTGAGSLVGTGPGLLLLEESSGVIRAVRASGEGFTEVGRATVFTPGVRSVTGPSIGSGGVFVRNLKAIAAFDVAR